MLLNLGFVYLLKKVETYILYKCFFLLRPDSGFASCLLQLLRVLYDNDDCDEQGGREWASLRVCT